MIKKLLTRLLDTALKLRVIPVNILNPKKCRLLHLVKNKKQITTRLTSKNSPFEIILYCQFTQNIVK